MPNQNRRQSWFRRLGVSAATLMMLTASACAGGGGVAGQASSAAGGGAFVLGQSAPINNLLPHGFQQSNMAWDRALYDSLMAYQGDEVKPWLAKSVDVSTDGKVYTITLNEGVKFHDGKALTSQIVADNFAWAADPKNLVSGTAVIARGKVQVVSPSSLTVTFPEPAPQFPSLLAVLPIMDLTVDLASKPNGTGPYKLASFVANSSLKMVRNDSYWNTAHKPKASSYEVRVFTDNASAQAALSSNQIQVLAFPAFNQLAPLEAAGNKLASKSAPGNFMLRINAGADPFKDKRVRQALSMAIDRQTFVKVGAANKAQATCSVYPPGTPVYTEAADASCKYDLERAKSLLAEAGASNLTFSVDTSTVRQPELAAYMPILQEQLAKIGVTMKINDITATLMGNNITTGNYQVSTDWYPWGNADPALLFISRTWTPDLTFENFKDPNYGPMVLAAQGETDPAKRKALYANLNAYLMDQSFVIPIATRPYVYAVGPKAKSFDMDPLGMVDATAIDA